MWRQRKYKVYMDSEQERLGVPVLNLIMGYQGDKMRQTIIRLGFVVSALMMLLTGCKAEQKIEETGFGTEGETEASADIILPTGNPNYRKIPVELPARTEPEENPGTRARFSFTVNEQKYVFTETETFWVYSQSRIGEYDTQFMLNVKGNKVVLQISAQEIPEAWEAVYADDRITIYRQENRKTVSEDEVMYLTCYDMTYEVKYWSALVKKHSITFDKLYSELAQMGTAVVPAAEDETVSDIITGMSAEPVFEGYCIQFREAMPYSAYFICSPAAATADYDSVSILMSVQIPEWEDYAVLHIEPIPDYQERLESTGESFEGYPILVDYTGELRYFILGENGTCIYLDGMPGQADAAAKSYTAKQAAYIFEVVLTK